MFIHISDELGCLQLSVVNEVMLEISFGCTRQVHSQRQSKRFCSAYVDLAVAMAPKILFRDLQLPQHDIIDERA